MLPGQDLLPAKISAKLVDAATMLIDEFIDDLSCEDPANFRPNFMSAYLPEKYQPKYNHLFGKKFVTCVMMVCLKLTSPEDESLSCLGEELAMNAIIERAEIDLEMRAEEGFDFSDFREDVFEDSDFEWLFDMKYDGIEDTEIGQYQDIANLHFEDWFKPFREDRPVHPYLV